MVYCIGNNNYDIFFDDGNVIGGAPGGSMLNVAVSLGRLKVPVRLVTRIGDDKLADFIKRFLKDSGVGVEHLITLPGKKTSLALVVLDKKKKPSYSFYGTKEPPPGFDSISFGTDDILLYGSSYAIDDSTINAVDNVIAEARRNNAVLIYDPNIRKKCALSVDNVQQRALRRMHEADIIKMSDEDVDALGLTVNDLLNQLPGKSLVITKGAKPVEFRRDNIHLQIEVPEISPVNTTGAGDAFSAGLIEALFSKNISSAAIPGLETAFWEQAMNNAIKRAASVCESHENYFPKKSS